MTPDDNLPEETAPLVDAGSGGAGPAPDLPEVPHPENTPRHWIWRYVRGAEDGVLALSLLAIMLLPLGEALLRKTFDTGIAGASVFTQHLVLLMSMLGAAVAAREARLLSLSTLVNFLHGSWRRGARLISGAVGATIALLLAYAAFHLVSTEIEYPEVIAYGIPKYAFQIALPIGFACIAVRILWHTSKRWVGRAVAAGGTLAFLLIVALAGVAELPVAQWVESESWREIWYDTPFDRAVGWLAEGWGMTPTDLHAWQQSLQAWLPEEPTRALRIPGLAVLLVAMLAGMPVFCTLGGLTLLMFFTHGNNIGSAAVDHFELVETSTLPTIPLFTLAGYFLAEGGASERLIRLFRALFGFFRGGPALVTVLICAFFTSFTGASGVTILALGGLLMPVLLKARFSERAAVGLLTGAGSNGTLFPPCLPLILYAIIADIPMEKMFLGGVIPSALLVSLTGLWGMRQDRSLPGERPEFSGKEALGAIWGAKWEVMIPVVAMAGLFSGLATPVEAAALTAFYAFVTQSLIHRDLRLIRDVPRVAAECGLLIGGVLLILGVARGFTNYLVDEQVPQWMVEQVTSSITSKIVFLLFLNVFLVLAGCLMDIYSAIVVIVPLIVRLGSEFGIHPVHLGIIFLANLELGYMTPPIGMNLFLSSYRFKKPIWEVCRAVFPYALLQFGGVLIITYIPFLSTALPEWLLQNSP